ncbi:Mur ligase domain-containing protein, partial [Balneolaceae bacterium ANBcel3]|nr:Mur ligase domain-containing protein [Balneolaceae bacterium ANBcel3]
MKKIVRPESVNGTFDGTFRGVTIDSRTVQKKDVFVAIKGTASDGHDYIRDAIRKGAAAIITEEDPALFIPQKSRSAHVPVFLKVASTRSVLGPLAQAFANNPADSMKMTGITGTNGKTTI